MANTVATKKNWRDQVKPPSDLINCRHCGKEIKPCETGLCLECFRKDSIYSDGKTCKACGKPVGNSNETGYCSGCSPIAKTIKRQEQPSGGDAVLYIERVLEAAKKYQELEPLLRRICAIVEGK